MYASAHYTEARVEFMAGFELSHKPTFLFNAAECSRQLNDIERARTDYARYPQLDPNGKLAPLVKQRLTELTTTPLPAQPKPGEPEPGPAPAVAPTPQVKPVPTQPQSIIPPPAVVAQQHVATTGQQPTVIVTEQPEPLWKHKAVWIGVGVALVAGTVAIYAATRSHDMCAAPGCVMVQ